MKRIIAAALVAMLTFATGCGEQAEEPPKTESGIEVNKTEEELRDERELREIAESELAQPERVAALSGNAAAMWKLAGGTIAAGVEEADGVPKGAVCGTEDAPDIEAVLEFAPDLILLDRKSVSYEETVSLLDITEGAPAYLTIDIHSFDDYADGMLAMAKYTKDTGAYQTRVIDVRKKNAEVIARGREALEVLIQTMPLPEGSLLPEADDESMMETPDQAKTDSAPDSVESHGAESGSDDPTASGAAESGTDDSTETQSTESALDSTAESYPADVEKVADKRESITVLLMRVDAEGCTIQGSHDYVSNMFADFGLINVNPGYEEVRVTLPKEEEEMSSAAETVETATGKTAENKTESGVTDSVVESGAEADSQATDGTETASAMGSEAGADSRAADGTETENASEPEAGAASQADSKETTDQTKARPANEIEFETILSRNPDYIFVIYEGKEKAAEQTYKAICESREFWGDMTAVRNRHVYTLPQSTFAYPPNDQWDLAYEYLYQMMFVM